MNIYWQPVIMQRNLIFSGKALKAFIGKRQNWDNRIQECARITADNVLERMQTMLDATVRKGGLVAVAGAVTDADEPEETDVGMAPPEAVEELSEEVDDFLSDFFGYL